MVPHWQPQQVLPNSVQHVLLLGSILSTSSRMKGFMLLSVPTTSWWRVRESCCFETWKASWKGFHWPSEVPPSSLFRIFLAEKPSVAFAETWRQKKQVQIPQKERTRSERFFLWRCLAFQPLHVCCKKETIQPTSLSWNLIQSQFACFRHKNVQVQLMFTSYRSMLPTPDTPPWHEAAKQNLDPSVWVHVVTRAVAASCCHPCPPMRG